MDYKKGENYINIINIYHSGDLQHAGYSPNIGRIEADIGCDGSGRRCRRRRISARKSSVSHLYFLLDSSVTLNK